MCRHSNRSPRKLQLLSFRQIVMNSSKPNNHELEFISKIPLLWNTFAHINFIISSHYRITRRGRCSTLVEIVQGRSLFNHITQKIIDRKFDINFWCLECNSFCSECIDFHETDTYKYTTQLANCKNC